MARALRDPASIQIIISWRVIDPGAIQSRTRLMKHTNACRRFPPHLNTD